MPRVGGDELADRTAHLEMIQGVINRLSQNSFLLKGWTVVLVTGLLAFAATGSDPTFAYLAYFPVLAFWWLDAYFLHLERRFRALYDHVRTLDDVSIDFSMDTSRFARRRWAVLWVGASKTLLVYHGVLLATVVAVTLFSVFNDGKGV